MPGAVAEDRQHHDEAEEERQRRHREIDDHVYCMYEYPAPGYDEDKNKKVVVTYSSINGNGFGDYGDDHVRIALIENEHRLRQALRGIREMFRKDGLLKGAA